MMDVKAIVFLLDPATRLETWGSFDGCIVTNVLDFKIPPLASGQSSLNVRTTPTNNGLRRGDFGSLLEIVCAGLNG